MEPQIPLSQVISTVAPVIGALSLAVAALFGWLMRGLIRLEKKLDDCESRHAGMAGELANVTKKAANLEGRIEEIKRYSPSELALEIAKQVKELI